MKTHKHKWFKTTQVEEKSRQSYACKCGQWKIETISEGEFEILDIKLTKLGIGPQRITIEDEPKGAFWGSIKKFFTNLIKTK